jgi:hypothetical protein
MRERVTIVAVLLVLLGLAGADSLNDWLLGEATLSQASRQTLVNLSKLLDHPLVRLCLILAALWLFGVAGSRLADRAADEEKKTRIEAERLAAAAEARSVKPREAVLAIEKRNVLAIEIERFEAWIGRYKDAVEAKAAILAPYLDPNGDDVRIGMGASAPVAERPMGPVDAIELTMFNLPDLDYDFVRSPPIGHKPEGMQYGSLFDPKANASFRDAEERNLAKLRRNVEALQDRLKEAKSDLSERNSRIAQILSGIEDA